MCFDVADVFKSAFYLFKIAGEIDNWWDSDTEESYKKKAQCMIDQYSSFTAKQV
jgi:predicted metalloendopeptidase